MTTRCELVGPCEAGRGSSRIDNNRVMGSEYVKPVLSRKGFDSNYGRCASPILEDDSMVSLPIPSVDALHSLCEATRRSKHFKTDVVADLTRHRAPANRQSGATPIHLDPYLNRGSSDISDDWRPAFGQYGDAQGHPTRKDGVCVRDLFLFFGWFRKVEVFNGRWRHVPKGSAQN